MNYSDILIYIMEMLGSVAFASSGAMLGIERKMDLFGVNVLGVTTAVGGSGSDFDDPVFYCLYPAAALFRQPCSLV